MHSPILRTRTHSDVLCDLYLRKELRNPRGWKPIDLRRIAHSNLYAECAETGAEAAATAHERATHEHALAGVASECDRLVAQLRDAEAACAQLLESNDQVEVQQTQLELCKSTCTCLDDFE